MKHKHVLGALALILSLCFVASALAINDNLNDNYQTENTLASSINSYDMGVIRSTSLGSWTMNPDAEQISIKFTPYPSLKSAAVTVNGPSWLSGSGNISTGVVTLTGTPPTSGGTYDVSVSCQLMQGDATFTGTMTVVDNTTPVYNVRYYKDNVLYATKTATAGERITLISEGVSVDGHTLTGWRLNSASGTLYSLGASYTVNSDVSFYGSYTVNSYKISYNANGGTGTINAVTGEYQSVITLPRSGFTKTGYTLSGWNTLSNGAGTHYDLGASYSINTPYNYTLYAEWTPITYTVTFNANGGSSVSPQSVIHGASASAPTPPTKDGYIFEGWYSNSSLTAKYNFETSTITSNTILYAKWITPQGTHITDGTHKVEIFTGSEYSETFTFGPPDLSSFDEISSIRAEFSNGTSSQFGLTITKVSDYIYTVSGTPDEAGSTTVGLVVAGHIVDVGDREYTLYTIDYTVKSSTYAVEFRANGGTFSDGSSVKNINVPLAEKYTLPVASDVSRSGYRLAGWYPNQFTEMVSDPGAEDSKSAYWTAVWTEQTTYTISFNANGGTGTMSSMSGYELEKITLPNSTFTRTGYTFEGWGTTSDKIHGDYQPTDKYTISGNATLYAVWAREYYTVTFNANGGTAVSETISVQSQGTYGNLPAAERDGYNFDGWYTSVSGGTKVTSSTKVTATGSHTLYAHWTIKTYTVSFSTGEGSSIAPQTVEHGKTASKPADPVNGSSTFDGWYTDEECTAVFSFSSQITGNMTLYAKWIVPYIVSFNTNGGSELENQLVKRGEKASKPDDPVKEGYIFLGWYTNLDLTNEYNFGSDVTSDFTLFAGWSLKTYTVIFSSNGSSAVENQMVSHGSKPARPDDPVREGFTFGGWYSDSALTEEYTFTTKVTSDLTLYAKWYEDLTFTSEPSLSDIKVTVDGRTVTASITADEYEYILWDMGNGEVCKTYTNNITYTYDNTGKYKIKAVAVNSLGESEPVYYDIEIGDKPSEETDDKEGSDFGMAAVGAALIFLTAALILAVLRKWNYATYCLTAATAAGIAAILLEVFL